MGHQKRGGPKKRFKDQIKRTLQDQSRHVGGLSLNRSAWRSACMTGTKTIEGEQRQQAEVLNEKPALHRLQLSLALPVLVSSTHVSVYSLTPNGNTLIPGTILNPRALPN